MKPVVLDASALLALLHREPGWEMVMERIDGAILSTINLIEVMDKLNTRGMNAEAARSALDWLRLDIRDFTRPLAEAASALLPHTKPFGLSLADRACLSLAQQENATALTGDRAWQKVQDIVDIDVLLIR